MLAGVPTLVGPIGGGRTMQALLAVVVTWLSINLGLPATREAPRVELATPAQMAAVRYGRLVAAQPERMESRHAMTESFEDVFAIYDDASRTIYLHEDWTGTTPADSSLLVHEMVHHLQNMAGMTFACPGEREKDAYRAQRAWLELFDRTLEGEFGIDPMTLLVRTSCGM
jgi:hypothetical protein